MIETTITASILIVIILILRLVFKKIVRRTVIYALWAIVALRLLLPFSLFESPASVMNIVPPPKPDFSQSNVISIDASTIPASEINNTPTKNLFSFIDLRFIWLSGVLLTSLCFIYSNALFTIKLYKTRKRIDSVPIPVYISDAVPSPCLYGIFKPCIYITPQSLDSLDYIIKHELAHYKQKDHLAAIVRCACVCIHWFNPLVWLASAVSRIDGELACDERTIKAIGKENRTEYGKLLISMASGGGKPALCLATSFSWDKKQLAQRIKFIAKKPKTIVTALALLAAFACTAVLVTFGSAQPASKAVTPDDAPPSEARLAVAQGFLKSAFTAPNQIFTAETSNVDNINLAAALKGVCGDYADDKVLKSNGQLANTIRYLQIEHSRYGGKISFNSAKIGGSGDNYDYNADVTITTADGIETRTEYIGVLQFNQEDKINFFTAKPKDSEAYKALSFNEILSPYVNVDYTLPTLITFQPSVHLSGFSTEMSGKKAYLSLWGDEPTINKYKKPADGSSPDNYHYRLRQAALIVLKLCPEFDTVVLSLKSSIEYEFTRSWAQEFLGDSWDMPVDTASRLEEWFELAKNAANE